MDAILKKVSLPLKRFAIQMVHKTTQSEKIGINTIIGRSQPVKAHVSLQRKSLMKELLTTRTSGGLDTQLA